VAFVFVMFSSFKSYNAVFLCVSFCFPQGWLFLLRDSFPSSLYFDSLDVVSGTYFSLLSLHTLFMSIHLSFALFLIFSSSFESLSFPQSSFCCLLCGIHSLYIDSLDVVVSRLSRLYMYVHPSPSFYFLSFSSHSIIC